ncbi:enoyl-CoA hydratase/isomerase family protein [Spartinivicinus ruber]|uniref:enoyl-CoA hydratase/isomerase family protein n=1 Tax=Spartinivicinus ruber TaxID=2683272 RepID=UPI0013D23288|nr:enoyl-CoA hydratase/isomerase family protein [Spartinivicinus ruber]
MSQSAVLFEELPVSKGKRLAKITLNRAKALNAIDLEMIMAIFQQLQQWRSQPDIVAVWLEGEGGRAFCAGGDIRKLYLMLTEQSDHRLEHATVFFQHEYQLDYLIHTYPKPIICWGSGIVMGGGLGLMVGASHRIVTETSQIAMPEINIGLYPDVSGTWFLSRLPSDLGCFIGLTGAALNAADSIRLGFADYFISTELKAECLDTLIQADWEQTDTANKVLVGRLLKPLEKQAWRHLPASKIVEHWQSIRLLFGLASLLDIDVAVKYHAAKPEDDWLTGTLQSYINGCPTTAWIVWEQIQRGRHLSLADAFQLELILSVQCCLHPDLAEGVRARLIDRDNQPGWYYKSVAEVPTEWVEGHFQAPWAEDVNPLKHLLK